MRDNIKRSRTRISAMILYDTPQPEFVPLSSKGIKKYNSRKPNPSEKTSNASSQNTRKREREIKKQMLISET